MLKLRALVVLVLTTAAFTLFTGSAGANCIQTPVTDGCLRCPPRLICTM